MTQLGYGSGDSATIPSPVTVGGSGGTIGFYGTSPIARRTGTIQGTAACAASVLSVSTGLGAWAAEVQATLVALGLWAGA
jgi:hypothetical protein